MKPAAAHRHATARQFGFIASETPCYVGRAIAALAADSERQRFSGGVFSSGTLSEIYEFADIDGTRPNMNRYLAENHAELMKPKDGVIDWRQMVPEPVPA